MLKETEKSAEIKPADNENKKKKTLKEIRSFVTIFFSAFLLLHVVISLRPVPTTSMEPTIPAHSVIAVWQLPFVLGNPVPSRGDVVVFYDAEDNYDAVKRCIGLPGDLISFRDGYVYLNGELLDETYLKEQGSTFCETAEFVVPENCFFAMGDNRENSFDSRFTEDHFYRLDAIRGRCIAVFHINRNTL